MIPSNYLPGDIVGVKGGFMAEIAYHLFKPATKLYHFLVIGEYLGEENDYVIYEAIASGVRIGRLSWYGDDVYVVFRVNVPEPITPGQMTGYQCGRRAVDKASAFGRWGYDWAMFVSLAADLARIYIRNLFRGQIRRIAAEELTYRENHAFICTEFAAALWRGTGYCPIPEGVVPLPAGYVQAFTDGKLDRVWVNVGPKHRLLPISQYILPNVWYRPGTFTRVSDGWRGKNMQNFDDACERPDKQ
jgi:hypothetical protein